MAMASGQVGIHPGEKNLALGLDPGRNKTGFAFVNLDGELLIAGIFSTAERDRFFDADDFSFSSGTELAAKNFLLTSKAKCEAAR